MRSRKKRVDDLGSNLTPTQVVLQHLAEILPLGSMRRYMASLKGRPDDAWPLYLLPKQAEDSVRKASKGKSWDVVNRRVREDVRDTVFLWYLHMNMNGRIAEELRSAQPMTGLLLLDVSHRLREDARRSSGADAWMRACRDLPYPLDQETASAVEASLANWVVTWDFLQDAGIFEEWAFEEIYRRAGEAEDREVVADREVATVSKKLERALRHLVKSGKVEGGKLVKLKSVPHTYLSDTPLVEGRWIDVTAIELAELGAILDDAGYEIREPGDDHSLAWDDVGRPDKVGNWEPIDSSTWSKTRASAQARVRKYRGKRRSIGKRPHIEFSGYQRWRAGQHGSRLKARTVSGFLESSWNAWVEDRGEKATLAGIPVAPIQPRVDSGTWTVHSLDSARDRQGSRVDVLTALQPTEMNQPSSTTTEGRRNASELPWRDHAEGLLALVEGLDAALDQIRARYFKGHEIVYSDLAEGLAQCRKNLRLAIGIFNDRLKWESWRLAGSDGGGIPSDDELAAQAPDCVDVEAVERGHAESGRIIAEYIINQARFEALAFIGERDAAKEILVDFFDTIATSC